MNRTKWIGITGIATLLLTAGGFFLLRGDPDPSVQVAVVRRAGIQSKVSANGKIQAVKKVDISANLMGQVTRLVVKEGDAVKAGDFLLEIDPVRSRAVAQGLEANLQATIQDLETLRTRQAQARNDFQRAEANYRSGIISQSEYEQVKTALAALETSTRGALRRVDQARANLAEARDLVNKTTLKAPMDGVVTARRIEQGETAVIGLQNQPGTVLLTISDMSRVEAEMEVDEASIPDVKLGQAAIVHIDAYPNQNFKAVVTEVGGSPLLKFSQTEATKFKVKIQIKDPPLTIKPGLSAQAEISTGSRANAVAVPIQAMVVKETKLPEGESPVPDAPKEMEGVFILERGRAKFVAVKTGLMGELNLEVLEGLKGGETIITGPFHTLRELKGGESVSIDKNPKKDDKKLSGTA